MEKEKMELLRSLGLKMTPQRLAILEYLDGNTMHPSAEDIYREVIEKFPSMSFATVYNTLEALKEKGLVMELTIEGGKKRFDPNTEPHHHFMCVKCKRIIDIFEDFPVELPEKYKDEFDVEEYHVYFYGTCNECRAS